MTNREPNEYPLVTLLKGREKRFESGHQWIFSNELNPMDIRPEAGDIVNIGNTAGKILGVGFYHPHSLISVRLLSRKQIIVDEAFLEERISQAIQFRHKFLTKDNNAARLVHAESDGLPGLIVDRYANTLVLQILSAGMDRQRNIVISILKKLVNPDRIILRNDHPMRKLENLNLEKQIVFGTDNDIPLMITENSVHFLVDPLNGQKTGFYIDQRDNRMMFRKYINSGDRVLDAFCHSGGFALNAALAGAGEVLAVDDSGPVLEIARENYRINGFEHIITSRKADMMKLLPEMVQIKSRFDAINLDPPSFAANRKSVGAALRGYRKIHRAALTILTPGGILATSSCSHHITEDAFMETVQKAGRDTGKQVQLIYRGSNPPDHPILPEMPETGYLKFLIFRLTELH